MKMEHTHVIGTGDLNKMENLGEGRVYIRGTLSRYEFFFNGFFKNWLIYFIDRGFDCPENERCICMEGRFKTLNDVIAFIEDDCTLGGYE